MPNHFAAALSFRGTQLMHGNRILLRTLLVFGWSSAVWTVIGWQCRGSSTGTFVWPYLLASVALVALIVFYRHRIRRLPPFTNQAYAMRLLTWSWLACTTGAALSLVPL